MRIRFRIKLIPLVRTRIWMKLITLLRIWIRILPFNLIRIRILTTGYQVVLKYIGKALVERKIILEKKNIPPGGRDEEAPGDGHRWLPGQRAEEHPGGPGNRPVQGDSHQSKKFPKIYFI
jgi:hypothetical protein